MASLVSNLRLKLLFRPQPRLCAIPCSRATFCSKGREQSSSVPLRYVPKKSSTRSETSNSSAFKGSRESKYSDRLDGKNLLPVKIPNNVRVTEVKSTVFEEKSVIGTGTRNGAALRDHANQGLGGEIDQGFRVRDNQHMEEPLEVIEEIDIHEEEDTEELDALQVKEIAQKYLSCSRACETVQDAEKLATELLAARAFTAVELRKKLIGKGFSPKIVDTVINNFLERGWINDGLYAETFSQSRWSASSWGPRRIKQALLTKGVSPADAEKAIKHVFEGCESDEGQESKLGMSKPKMDQLFVQASKQWLRSQDVSRETRKSRVIRWLQYRGFNWGIICIIIKKLEAKDPT